MAEDLKNDEDRFSAEDLALMKGLRFKRPYVERLLAKATDLSNGFHRHLLSISMPAAVRFDEIMVKYDGSPMGVEFRSKHRDAWAFVLPDASEQGKFRIQYFDRNGFASHHSDESVEACVNQMVADGYTVEDAGALDGLVDTAEWKRGVEVAALMQRLNSKQISYREFSELVCAL